MRVAKLKIASYTEYLVHVRDQYDMQHDRQIKNRQFNSLIHQNNNARQVYQVYLLYGSSLSRLEVSVCIICNHIIIPICTCHESTLA